MFENMRVLRIMFAKFKPCVIYKSNEVMAMDVVKESQQNPRKLKVLTVWTGVSNFCYKNT